MARYLRAEDRRKQAQRAAIRLLDRGAPVFDLTLRAVAEEMGTPLSTLTYVYPAVDLLLADLVVSFQMSLRAEVFNHGPRDQGLRSELRRAGRLYFCLGPAQRVGGALMRYRLALSLKDEPTDRPAAEPATETFMTQLLARIAEDSQEEYQMPIPRLGVIAQALVDGLLLRYFAHEDRRRYYQDIMAGADTLALAAAPRPVGTPPPLGSPFRVPDYRRISPPPCGEEQGVR